MRRTQGEAILARLSWLGPAPQWRREIIGWQRDLPIAAFRKDATVSGQGKLYLSAGIHGDEPAGPLALIDLLEAGCDFVAGEVWVFPVLAPDALRAGSRTNIHGVDLNRDYRNPRTDEVRAHLAALSVAGPFDLALCLHEDWEAQGSYIYELNRSGRPGIAEVLLGAMAAHIPPDPRKEIDGRPASDGIIRPVIRAADRPDWPEAIFLSELHCPLVYTLETPSGFELDRRIAAQKNAVLCACRSV